MYSMDNRYINSLKKLYEDPKTFDKHKIEIQKIINYSKSKKAKLIVMIIPLIGNLDSSCFYINRIQKYLSSQGVRIINLKEKINHLDNIEMVINRFDSHLSAKGNSIAAMEIIKEINLCKE